MPAIPTYWKECRICKQTKDLDDFPVARKNSNGEIKKRAECGKCYARIVGERSRKKRELQCDYKRKIHVNMVGWMEKAKAVLERLLKEESTILSCISDLKNNPRDVLLEARKWMTTDESIGALENELYEVRVEIRRYKGAIKRSEKW